MLLSDRILTIDAEAMILDKPAGLPVDTPKDGALAVENHLDALRLGFVRRPTIVHRLDRDTSGCLLLARNPKAHRRFAAAFEAGEIQKVYLAILAGVPDAGEGIVELALSKVSTRADGWRMVPAKKGKSARSRWRVLDVRDGRALVRFDPETGRTHQLRVHAAEGIGHAIAGDPVYGDGRGPMLLHAWRLTVPRGAKPPTTAIAPPPDTFAAFAGVLADAAV